MNVASRMESNSIAGRIQLSAECAKLLKDAGKGHWLELREGKVVANGKGALETYFLDIAKSQYTRSISAGESLSDDMSAEKWTMKASITTLTLMKRLCDL